MANKYIGLDLGNAHIKAVTIIENGGKFELNKAYSLPMPDDCINDDIIMNYADIAEQIAKIIQSGDFPKIPISLALKGSTSVSKFVRVPYVKKDTLEMDLRFMANQYICINPDDNMLDYKVVKLDATRSLAKVVYASTTKEVMSDYISIMESAQQKLNVVDIETLALCDLYSYMKLADEGVALILDIGHSNTEMIFIKDGIFAYHTLFSTAGKMCSSLLLEKTKVPAESIDLVKANPDAFPAGKEVTEIILNEYIPHLLADIEMGISKYIITGGEKPKNIYLSGGGATTIGLIPALEENYGVNVSIMDPASIISISDPIAMQIVEQKPAALNIAIAMALR